MFITLENIQVHYQVSGTGEPLILLHGWGGNIGSLAKFRDHLINRFTVYALDLPGFGLSTIPETNWTGTRYANLIKLFIDNLKINKPIIIGHSFGGKILIELVARNQGCAKKIILISSSGVRLPKSFKVKAKIYFFKLLKFLGELPIIRSIFAQKIALFRKKLGSKDYQNATGIMRAILVTNVGEDITGLLPQVKVPTLIIWGDQDAETPLLAAKILNRDIEGSQLKVIPGSGHFPYQDNWEKIKIELDHFLEY